MRTLVVVAVLVALGCSPKPSPAPTATPQPTPEARSADYYVRLYGGLAGAYRSILEETSCDTLQEELYVATDNKSVGFQDAIIARGHDLHCPDLRFTRP